MYILYTYIYISCVGSVRVLTVRVRAPTIEAPLWRWRHQHVTATSQQHPAPTIYVTSVYQHPSAAKPRPLTAAGGRGLRGGGVCGEAGSAGRRGCKGTTAWLYFPRSSNSHPQPPHTNYVSHVVLLACFRGLKLLILMRNTSGGRLVVGVALSHWKQVNCSFAFLIINVMMCASLSFDFVLSQCEQWAYWWSGYHQKEMNFAWKVQ